VLKKSIPGAKPESESIEFMTFLLAQNSQSQMSSAPTIVQPNHQVKHRMLHYLSKHIGYTTLEQISRYTINDAREAEERIRELVSNGLAKKSNNSINSYKITLKGEFAIASSFHASLILLAGVIALLSAISSLSSSLIVGGALFAFSAGLFAYIFLMFRSRKSLNN
jgi:predicted transcriptional regulator